jgi:hypothetical protein
VFWHWRFSHVEKIAYQQSLIDFHTALRTQKPPGFQYSMVFQLEHAPWLSSEGEVYEEWYVLENSAALDVLNQAAIAGLCQEPHKQVAIGAAGGAGGLYQLRAGEPSLATTHMALWFAKPPGMTYQILNETLQAEITKSGACLWQRQMTLGPTLEFCWHSAQDHTLPEFFECLKIPLKQVWVGYDNFGEIA